MHVNIKGVGMAQFPDDMSVDDIRTFLQKKFSTNLFDASQPISLPNRPQTIEPVEKSLAQRAGQGISDFLSDTGIISNPSRAHETGQTLSALGELLPGIGDVAAGDEFGRALAEGDALGVGLSVLGVVPVVGDVVKKFTGANPVNTFNTVRNRLKRSAVISNLPKGKQGSDAFKAIKEIDPKAKVISTKPDGSVSVQYLTEFKPKQVTKDNPFLFEFDPDALEVTENTLKRTDNFKGNLSDPISVTKSEGDFFILDGHHRAAIAKERGQTINAIVIPKADVKSMRKKGLNQADMLNEWIKSKPILPMDVANKLDKFGKNLRDKIDFNPKAAVIEYNAIPDSNSGKILNTDIARELSPDYLKDRSLSASVHEPASAFIKRRYSEILKEAPKPGENAAVLFTAGGTGAGKTTGVTGLVGTDKYQVVFDTNMSNLGPARKKIEQALEAGKNVDIVMVYRDPVEAFLNGSLKRSIRQAKVSGTGRTVPLKAHIDSHKGSLEVTGKLNKIYKDNPNVTVSAIDNSRGKGQQAIISVEQLDKFKGRDYNQVRKDILKLLEESHDKGEITEKTFKGFKE